MSFGFTESVDPCFENRELPVNVSSIDRAIWADVKSAGMNSAKMMGSRRTFTLAQNFKRARHLELQAWGA
jgi:hypothetical protein